MLFAWWRLQHAPFSSSFLHTEFMGSVCWMSGRSNSNAAKWYSDAEFSAFVWLTAFSIFFLCLCVLASVCVSSGIHVQCGGSGRKQTSAGKQLQTLTEQTCQMQMEIINNSPEIRRAIRPLECEFLFAVAVKWLLMHFSLYFFFLPSFWRTHFVLGKGNAECRLVTPKPPNIQM